MDALCSAYIRQDGSLGDEVADHEEAATSYIQSTEKCLFHPVGEFADTPLVTAKFVVVEVVDDNVVRTRLTLTETTWRLPTATSQEIHPVLGGELTLRPVAERHLFAEISNDAFVILELRLNVTQQSVGGVLGLSDNHHEIDEPLRLEHQPERHEDVEVCGLGVTAWPLEDRLQVRRVFYEFGCRIVKWGIVDGAYGFASHLVTECKEMRKVILTESGIVFLEAAYALLLLGGILTYETFRVGQVLDLPAMLPPLLLYFLKFRYSGHSLEFCRVRHLFHEELVLVLVDGLDKFRRDVRIVASLVLNPSIECHEDLDGIDDVCLLVEFLNR